jgi:signal transduction histidine kinase
MPQRSVLRLSMAVVGAGLVAAVVVAATGHMPAHDTVELVGWAVGGAAATAAVAWVLLWRLRRGPVMLHATITALAPVLAVTVGVLGGTSVMVVGGEGVRPLVVIIVSAATMGIVTALILGSRLARASDRIGEIAVRIGQTGDAGSTVAAVGPKGLSGGRTGSGMGRRGALPTDDGPEEMARLAGRLDDALVRLCASQAHAEALDASRRELVAWVSHDLRTPLTGIRAMVEALEDGLVNDDDVGRYLATIRHEVDRLSCLVAELFELSRIQAGALNLEYRRVPVHDMVADVAAGAAALASAKGVDLRTEPAERAAVAELAVPELSRALRNLVDNAIRHTPTGGCVRLAAGLDPTGTRASMSVTDACGGIDPDELERIFEVAYRGDAARSPDATRAGLGLAIARGLVEAQRGEIHVANARGGCRFVIRVPVAAASA